MGSSEEEESPKNSTCGTSDSDILNGIREASELAGGREWRNALLNCMASTDVCLPGIIPCFLGIQLVTILGEPLASVLWFGGVSSLRTRFRTKFGIAGNTCNDCLSSHILCPCTICQMMIEIRQI